MARDVELKADLSVTTESGGCAMPVSTGFPECKDFGI